jgi:hypothetical protein
VLEVSPVMLLVKLPVPVPSAVLPFVRVGILTGFQQTPREVTAAPPSEVTSPPLSAEFTVIFVTAALVTVGTSALLPSFLQPCMTRKRNEMRIIKNEPVFFIMVESVN